MLKKTSFYYIIHSPGPKTSMESDVKDELTRDRVARPVARLSRVFQFIWWTSEKSCSAPCMMEMYGYTTALSYVLRFSEASRRSFYWFQVVSTSYFPRLP